MKSLTRTLLIKQRRNLLARLKRAESKEFPNYDNCQYLIRRIVALENDIDQLESCGL